MLRLILIAILLPALLDACCMPKKFFAIRTNARTGLRSSYVVDFDLQRNSVAPQGDHPVRWIVNDFATGLSYTMYKTGKCRKTKVIEYYLYYRCKPATAKFEYKDFLGKDFALPIWTYYYQYRNTKVEMTVTRDGNCYPILRRQDPVVGVAEEKAISFSNVKVVANTDPYLKRDFSSCV